MSEDYGTETNESRNDFFPARPLTGEKVSQSHRKENPHPPRKIVESAPPNLQ